MAEHGISLRFSSFLAGVFLALSLGGCGVETGAPHTSVVDSAGVAMITLSGEDEPLAWSVERVLEIPPAEADDEGFFGVTDLDVLSGGRIAVLDGDAKKVVLFDDQGGLLSQYGREGSGPGEFQYPLQLIPTPEDGLFVYDMGNARFERFDATLSPLAPDPIQTPFSGGRMAFVGSHLVFPIRELGNPKADVQIVTAIRESDTVRIVRSERPRGGPVQFESCGLSLSGIPPLFSPRTLWAPGPEGVMAVVDKGWYEVNLYRGPEFGLERIIRRDVPAIQATREMAEAQVGEGMRVMTPAGERVCDPTEVVEEQGFAPEIPPVTRVVLSPDGEIYLERWAPRGENGAIDVLSPEGEYLGTLAPGFPFPEAFLGTDRIVVREEDELELTSVVVYRIRR